MNKEDTSILVSTKLPSETIAVICPNCKRRKDVEDNVIISVCPCGEMVEVENGNNKSR